MGDQVFDLIEREHTRQQEGLELTASENYVSREVLQAQGSILTNKYAEGYPAKRYYGGCEVVDDVERLAIDRVLMLFGAQAANVQPHSGSQANMASYLALAPPGSKILGMSLAQGGHLTHGSPVNFSGKLYEVSSYGLDPKTERLDYDSIRAQALREKPAILVAGASAYPRKIDFEAFGQIARDSKAELVVDMAHVAGLVAARLHPSPIPYATYVTSTTHKTLRGPRGGFILCSQERLKAVNSAIFPGIQGGPLVHVIAAKAVAFGEALKPSFVAYQKTVIENCQALAEVLMAGGLRLVTRGKDNHLLLADLTNFEDGQVTGQLAEDWLAKAAITVNKNTVPNETRSPFVTSGIRIGTPAISTRGAKPGQMASLGQWILEGLKSKGDGRKLGRIRALVVEFCQTLHPVPRL